MHLICNNILGTIAEHQPASTLIKSEKGAIIIISIIQSDEIMNKLACSDYPKVYIFDSLID